MVILEGTGGVTSHTRSAVSDPPPKDQAGRVHTENHVVVLVFILWGYWSQGHQSIPGRDQRQENVLHLQTQTLEAEV